MMESRLAFFPIASLLAGLLAFCQTATAAKPEPAALTAEGEKLAARYTGMLESLRAEVVKALPPIDEAAKAAFLTARAEFNSLRAPRQDATADAQKEYDEAHAIAEEKALVAAREILRAIDGFLASEAEDAIAAVGRGVLCEGVVVALLEDEETGGILAAVVNAFAMAADAEVAGVSGNDIGRGPPERDAPAGEEGTVVVEDSAVGDPIENDAVLGFTYGDVADANCGGIFDADRRAVVAAPFFSVVGVGPEPIGGIFRGGCGAEALAEVVAVFAAVEEEAVGFVGEKADFEALDVGVFDCDA